MATDEPDDKSLYPEEYSDPEWLGMKRMVIPYPDGFVDDRWPQA